MLALHPLLKFFMVLMTLYTILVTCSKWSNNILLFHFFMKGLLNLQLVNWSTIIFITFHFEGLDDYMSFQLKLRLSPQIWSLVVRMTCVFSSWVGKFLYFNRLFFKHLVYLFHFFTSSTLGLVLQQPLPSSFVLRWPSPSPSPITFSVVGPISDILYHSHPICPPQFCSRWSFSISFHRSSPMLSQHSILKVWKICFPFSFDHISKNALFALMQGHGRRENMSSNSTTLWNDITDWLQDLVYGYVAHIFVLQ